LTVKTFVRRLAKLSTLRPADWRVLAESAATLLVIQAALFFVPIARLLTWIGPVRTGVSAPTAEGVLRVTWLLRVAARVTQAKCLATSLALSRMLARRGVATDLRIGVQTEGGVFKAHAWVEWQSRVLNDHPNNLRRFAVFDRPIGVPDV
jgi:hypothetical protein